MTGNPPLRTILPAASAQTGQESQPSEATSASMSTSSAPTSTSSELPRRKDSRVKVACEPCQKRKSKCDGSRPICLRCREKHTQCRYLGMQNETRTDIRKRERESLTHQVDGYQHLLNVLRSGSWIESLEVLRRLRSTENPEETIRLLQDSALLLPVRRGSNASISSGEDTSDTSDWPLRKRFATGSRSSTHPTAAAPPARSPPIGEESARVFSVPYINVPARPWTQVTGDDSFVSHLVSLYLAWEQPFQSYVDAEGFLRDMRSTVGSSLQMPPDDLELCSSLLVNAICARASQLTDDQRTLKLDGDRSSRGRLFADEAERLLQLESNKPSVTTIQAAWLLFTYHRCLGQSSSTGICARYLNTIYNMYNALELGDVQLRPTEYAISELTRRRWCSKSVTLWGLFVMERFTALCEGLRPRLKEPTIEMAFRTDGKSPISESSSELEAWYPYPMLRSAKSCSRRETLVVQVELAKLIDEILLYAVPDTNDVSYGDTDITKVMGIYDKLVEWERDLPNALWSDHQNVPHALLLHMYYHAAVVALFRPFQHFDNLSALHMPVPSPMDTNVDTPTSQDPYRYASYRSPASIIQAHAVAALDSIWQYRTLYFLPRNWCVMFGLNSVIFALVFLLPAAGSDLPSGPFARVCQALYECAEEWPTAAVVLAGMDTLAAKYDIELPSRAKRFVDGVKSIPNADPDMRLPMVKPDDVGQLDQGAFDGTLADLFKSLQLNI